MNDSRFAFSLPAKTNDVIVTAYLYSFQFVTSKSSSSQTQRDAAFSSLNDESVSSIVCIVLALPLVLFLRERPLK